MVRKEICKLYYDKSNDFKRNRTFSNVRPFYTLGMNVVIMQPIVIAFSYSRYTK